MGDVLHVLKFGYVYQEAQPATRGFFKYLMEGNYAQFGEPSRQDRGDPVTGRSDKARHGNVGR
jgi:hypothetical protein